MPWPSCVLGNWVDWIWDGDITLWRDFGRKKPQTHRKTAMGLFCCSWKWLFLNIHRNSFVVYWKVLSHSLCFTACLGSFFVLFLFLLFIQVCVQSWRYCFCILHLKQSWSKIRWCEKQIKDFSNSLPESVWEVSVIVRLMSQHSWSWGERTETMFNHRCEYLFRWVFMTFKF